MHAGDLKQQLAVTTAEGAEHNEKAIQASALANSLQAQVCCCPTYADNLFRIACDCCQRAFLPQVKRTCGTAVNGIFVCTSGKLGADSLHCLHKPGWSHDN